MILRMLLVLTLFIGAYAQAANKTKPVELNVHVGEEIRHLDPQVSSGIGSSHISINLFSGLFQYGPKSNLSTQDLVESYTKNEDASVWTFKLKDRDWVRYNAEKKAVEKVRKVTAHDFAYSWVRVVTPSVASEYAYMLYGIKNAEDFHTGKIKDPKAVGVKALDDKTFEVTLSGPMPTFREYLSHHSFAVVPKDLVSEKGAAWIKTPYCSGPFVFKEWRLKDRIIAVKNPFHPDVKKTNVDVINFVFIGVNSPRALLSFKAGEVDIDLSKPPVSAIPELKQKGLVKSNRAFGTYYLTINTTANSGNKALMNPLVRKALGLVIPRGNIVKFVTKSGETPTYALVPNALKDYKPQSMLASIFPGAEKVPSFKERHAKALAYLKEAGYENGKGIGTIRYMYNTSDVHKNIALLIAKVWKKALNVNVELENVEWKAYLQALTDKKYQVARRGWIGDYLDAINFLDMYLGTAGNNNTGFDNADYNKLITEARIQPNLEKRSRILEKAERLLMATASILPIYNYTETIMVQPYIQGPINPAPFHQHPLVYVNVDTSAREKMLKP